MDSDKLFFTVAELSKRWGVSRRQIYRLIELGDLTFVNFSSKSEGGKGMRVPIEDVLRHESKKINKIL